MFTIIDGDSPVFAACISQEKDGVVKNNGDLFMYKCLEDHIQRILLETQATDYKIFLTGKNNFRNEVSSTYKANRDPSKRPKLLEKARNFLEITHNAIMSTDREADDLVCQEQEACIEQGIDCCIAHIDKDINQQAGKHYRWETHNKEGATYTITEEEGLYNLYEQSLVGDKGDNIMYWLDPTTKTWRKEYGLGIVGARKALEGCKTEKEFQLRCLELYQTFTKKSDGTVPSAEDFAVNMQLLYLKRSVDDVWKLLV